MHRFSLLTLNIGNPSLKRVKQQIKWIEERNESVFILTETKHSEGCLFLEQHFTDTGWTMFDFGKEPEFNSYFPKSLTGDLGVMVLSKYPIVEIKNCFEKENRFYSRFIDVTLDVYGLLLGIIGIYVPSRDASQEKIERKKEFIIDFLQYIKNQSSDNSYPYIICGDLNVLESSHIPRYSNFKKWEYDFYDRFDHFGFTDSFRFLHPVENEYSWVGRTNDGYRYDHCFVSKSIKETVEKCDYIHETRKIPITDHSALMIELYL